jgi:PAS domain S-box-containing protein
MRNRTNADLMAEVQELRLQLEEAKDTLDAIRRGEVDGLVVSTPKGEQVYSISGAEKPYRALIEDMREGAVMLSDDNTVLYCNSGFAKMMKRPMEKIVGVNIESIICPTYIKAFRELLASARTRKVAMNKEITLQAGEDFLVPTLMSVNSLHSDTLKNTFLVVTDLSEHMDEDVKRYTINLEKEIAERKKAQEALRVSETHYRTLFSSIGEGFELMELLFDENKAVYDLRYLEVNDTYEKQTGLKAKDVVGKTVKELFPQIEGMWIEVFDKVIKTGLPTRLEDYHQDTNRYYSAYYFPFGKKEIGVLFSDITARKEAEEKLEEYSKSLEKVVEERTKQLKDSERLAAIGATAGMVGHDIRNPLQAITSDIYLAKTDLASTPESEEKKSVTESLQEIENNVDYINKIIQDLQDYARPLNPQVEEVDIKLIVEKFFEKYGISENIEIVIKIEADIGKILFDTYYINRILYNLLTNAVQAMPNGGTLTIYAFKEANDTIIAVKDTGVGIPKETQSKMFTPMFTTKSKGQGFGLPVVKRMTESLGGTVSFESIEGKGTTFFVRLPLKKNKT